MRRLAIMLLVGVFLAHDAANGLAEGTHFSPAAVFYMLQGAWGAFLSAVLLLLLIDFTKRTVWRDVAVFALIVSIIEGAQVAVCRLAIDDIAAVPRGTNLCDFVTGLPVSAVELTIYVIALTWTVGSSVVWQRDT